MISNNMEKNHSIFFWILMGVSIVIVFLFIDFIVNDLYDTNKLIKILVSCILSLAYIWVCIKKNLFFK